MIRNIKMEKYNFLNILDIKKKKESSLQNLEKNVRMK